MCSHVLRNRAGAQEHSQAFPAPRQEIRQLQQEKIKRTCCTLAELGKDRDAGSCPANFRGGDEEDHLHHSYRVPASGQQGTSDALLAAVGETDPP